MLKLVSVSFLPFFLNHVFSCCCCFAFLQYGKFNSFIIFWAKFSVVTFRNFYDTVKTLVGGIFIRSLGPQIVIMHASFCDLAQQKRQYSLLVLLSYIIN